MTKMRLSEELFGMRGIIISFTSQNKQRMWIEIEQKIKQLTII